MNRTTVERKSDREVVVTRTFDAPLDRVWRAWSDPELVTRWWGSSRPSIHLDQRNKLGIPC